MSMVLLPYIDSGIVDGVAISKETPIASSNLRVFAAKGVGLRALIAKHH
jgi:hypothetical protein